MVKLRTWRDNDLDADQRERTCSGGWTNPACRSRSIAASSGWDEHNLFDQRIRNYTKKPIEVEIRRALPRPRRLPQFSLGAKSYDYQTVEYTATVKPGQKADLLYEVLQHQGRNAKQNNVTVEEAQVKP